MNEHSNQSSHLSLSEQKEDLPSANALFRVRGRQQKGYPKSIHAYVIGLLLGALPYVLLFSLGYQHAASLLQFRAFFNVFFYSLSLFYYSVGNFSPLISPLCLVGLVILGIACLVSSRSRFVGLGVLTIVVIFATFFMLWLSS